jgi:phage terminase Nu1 subunit (DNA packaging protein)|nr:MAG TPA: DNA packaging protein [Caudoviricetes sp.]
MEVNQKQLAEVLGITTRQIRNLKQDGLFECIANSKRYSLERCVKEYIDFKIKAETGRGTRLNKEAEQAEHEKIKKEISKLKLRKMRKEIHEAADIEHFLSEMLLNFRNRLLSVPGKIAPMVIGEEDLNIVSELLKKEMLETLEELSEYNPDQVNGEDAVNYFEGSEDEDEEEEMEGVEDE